MHIDNEAREAVIIATAHHTADLAACAAGETLTGREWPVGYETGICTVEGDLRKFCGASDDEIACLDLRIFGAEIDTEYRRLIAENEIMADIEKERE